MQQKNSFWILFFSNIQLFNWFFSFFRVFQSRLFSFRLNQRGQGDDVFRLLIAAVMALAVLVIVFGIVSLVEEEKFKLSSFRFQDGFAAAVDLPTCKIVKQEKLFFKTGESYSATALARKYSLDETTTNCVQFFSSNSVVLVSTDHAVATMGGQVQTDVFFRCRQDNGCNPAVSCEIWFGKEPAPC